MTTVNPAFSKRMEPQIRAVRDAEQAVARIRRQIGPSEAFERFLSRYGKIRTQKAYAIHLQLYLKWLKNEGVGLTLDELVQDNLNCVFGAAPADVKMKRKHADLLHRYVNVHLLKRGIMESTRRQAFATIKMFYKRNDSPIFGDNDPGSKSINLTISQTLPKLVVSCSPVTFAVGLSSRCTATLKVSYNVTGETILWTKTSGLGGVSFSSSTCTLSLSATCSVTVTGTGVGHVVVKASYNGDVNNKPSYVSKVLVIT